MEPDLERLTIATYVGDFLARFFRTTKRPSSHERAGSFKLGTLLTLAGKFFFKASRLKKRSRHRNTLLVLQRRNISHSKNTTLTSGDIIIGD